MDTLKVLRDALTNKNDAIRAIFLKPWQVFTYILLLGSIMAIPNTLLAGSIIETFTANFETIAQKTPDYTVKNGSIQSDDNDSFIVQMDFITYAFDPEDKVSVHELQQINDSSFIIENEKEALRLHVRDQDYQILYEEDFNATTQKELFNNMGSFKPFTYPITFFLIMVSQMCYLWVINAMVGFASAFSNDTKRLDLKFSHRFRLNLLSITIPVVIFTILNLFQLYVPFQFELLLLISAFRTMRLMRKIKMIKTG